MKEMIAEIVREEMSRELQKKYYFMAGLPRSGSTLLSAILNQNPRFYSGPSSPVVHIMSGLENGIANDEFFKAYPKSDQAATLIANVIRHYYGDVDKPVIVDKNRSWPNHIHYISGYFGIEPKIIMPVRDLSEILASFIQLHKRNPHEVDGRINFIDQMLIKSDVALTDDNRCEFLAGQGVVGQCYNSIKQALLEGHQSKIHFVEYNDLVNAPEDTVRKIYDFLGEEHYTDHDFSNLENTNRENDASVYGFSDMHEIRNTVEKTSVDPAEVLSDNILEQCKDAEFWRDLDDIPALTQAEESSMSNDDNTEDETRLIGD